MLIRIIVILTSSIILLNITNPSVIYHSLRAQGLFKLYMLKAVCEIFDILLKGYGMGILENFSRSLYIFSTHKQAESTICQKLDLFAAVIGLTIYTTLHSFVLCFEMFTIHVVLTSSFDSLFSFLFYNALCEIKITVFKKCDIQGLYTYASNDSVERF